MSDNAEAFHSAVLWGVNEGTAAVDLDLSATRWFDTFALCTLVSVRRRLSLRGVGLRLVNPHFTVLSVLERTRTHQFFEVACDQPEPAPDGDHERAMVEAPDKRCAALALAP